MEDEVFTGHLQPGKIFPKGELVAPLLSRKGEKVFQQRRRFGEKGPEETLHQDGTAGKEL